MTCSVVVPNKPVHIFYFDACVLLPIGEKKDNPKPLWSTCMSASSRPLLQSSSPWSPQSEHVVSPRRITLWTQCLVLMSVQKSITMASIASCSLLLASHYHAGQVQVHRTLLCGHSPWCHPTLGFLVWGASSCSGCARWTTLTFSQCCS